MQPGAEKASFTPALDPARSGYTHARGTGMQPHAGLRPWVDTVMGSEGAQPVWSAQLGGGRRTRTKLQDCTAMRTAMRTAQTRTRGPAATTPAHVHPHT